jgi:histone acetyltransferase (RNA polymerase elongator complex component)
LIYLDDKTFGQAKNYTDLVEINRKIRKFNPDFQGFIIQTTAPQLLKMTDQFIQESGIQYIELGVESYNDDILSKVKKPHRTKQLDKAVIKIRKNI